MKKQIYFIESRQNWVNGVSFVLAGSITEAAQALARALWENRQSFLAERITISDLCEEEDDFSEFEDLPLKQFIIA